MPGIVLSRSSTYKMRKVHQGDPTISRLCNGCHTYGCTNALTDGDATLCSTCAAQCKARKLLEKVQKKQLEREARRLEKQTIAKDLYEYDVVCKKGRGDHKRFPGNKLYCHLINVNKEAYNELAFSERSNIIRKIISTIQEKDGWFVSHSEASGSWARLTEEQVQKKVSDSFSAKVRYEGKRLQKSPS